MFQTGYQKHHSGFTGFNLQLGQDLSDWAASPQSVTTVGKTFSRSLITVQKGKEVKGLPLDLHPSMTAKLHK